MAEFQLGDIVTYTNKSDLGGKTLKGPIISVFTFGSSREYVIGVEQFGDRKFSLSSTPMFGPAPLRRHNINVSNPDTQTDLSYFSGNNSLKRAMIPTYIVTNRAKNLKNAFKPYDPAQQPWTEDDI